MKYLKKTTALLLSVLLLFSAMVTGFTVTADGNTATITAAAVEAQAGANVDVPVTVDTTGLTAAIFTVTVDGLVVNSYAFGDDFKEVYTDVYNNEYTFAVTAKADADFAGTATVVTLNVAVPANAAAGTVLGVTVADATAADYAEAYVAVATANGSVTVKAAEVECDHANAEATVATQPTKDAEGVMTYTCECGHSWTETIDIPTNIVTLNANAKLQHNLTLADRVYDRFVFSVKQFSNLGYDPVNNGYFVTREYGKYEVTGGLYKYSAKSDVLLDSDKDVANSAGNGRSFFFNELALYEMTVNYSITVYVKDANGVVVAYLTDETSIADEALALAQSKDPTSDRDLLVCLADMMNYGKAAQDFFKRDGDDLSDAVSPTDVLGDFMSYASDESVLPAELPADEGLEKVVSTSSFNAKGNVVVDASTLPSFMVIAGNYEPEKTSIVVSYKNSYGNDVVEPVTVEPTLNSSNKWRYDFVFSGLAMYDLSETVTVSMSYNGVEEATYKYSLSYYVNQKISDATYTNILTKMAIFSRSARIQLLKSAAY